MIGRGGGGRLFPSPTCEEQRSCLSSNRSSDCISMTSSYSQEKSTEREPDFASNSSTISSQPYASGYPRGGKMWENEKGGAKALSPVVLAEDADDCNLHPLEASEGQTAHTGIGCFAPSSSSSTSSSSSSSSSPSLVPRGSSSSVRGRSLLPEKTDEDLARGSKLGAVYAEPEPCLLLEKRRLSHARERVGEGGEEHQRLLRGTQGPAVSCQKAEGRSQHEARSRSTSSGLRRERREELEKRKEEVRAWLHQQAPPYHPSPDYRRARGKMLEKLIKVSPSPSNDICAGRRASFNIFCHEGWWVSIHSYTQISLYTSEDADVMHDTICRELDGFVLSGSKRKTPLPSFRAVGLSSEHT